ncbi:MAG: bifunctional 4-hydroxy-2-oxoglutarate aldolase/2-dehydro-3-deoxy-phosphogluconate aldolase [Verrucomicrobia bacterium]|nr:bifunctional 4-hydroxy-2-oxoglutarate aldolase/2-dehydro-3-deoxy-phosphogluconate aldolase [Verrucomicrobiota bacterium]
MNNTSFTQELTVRIQQAGVVAVLTVDDPQDAAPLSRALLAGGVDCIELTLRTPAAIDALKRIKAETPQVLIGIGTILTPAQVADVVVAGAAFGVAPGMNPRVVRAAQEAGLPFAPGVATPSDIEQALELGCRVLKFFPAEPSGGLKYLKSMAAPYAHLGLRFIPLGGLEARHLETYLADSIIPAVGGSWLAPRDLIQQGNWQQITENARQAVEIIHRIRNGEKNQ